MGDRRVPMPPAVHSDHSRLTPVEQMPQTVHENLLDSIILKKGDQCAEAFHNLTAVLSRQTSETPNN